MQWLEEAIACPHSHVRGLTGVAPCSLGLAGLGASRGWDPALLHMTRPALGTDFLR